MLYYLVILIATPVNIKFCFRLTQTLRHASYECWLRNQLSAATLKNVIEYRFESVFLFDCRVKILFDFISRQDLLRMQNRSRMQWIDLSDSSSIFHQQKMQLVYKDISSCRLRY